ncbi:MAG TPA: hypothetical protein VK253_01270, partial [Candidatus Binatia bacterium]|nr:hypothetical protein [Candidatus Binatia bacterium]
PNFKYYMYRDIIYFSRARLALTRAFIFEGVDTAEKTEEPRQESLSDKTKVIVIGLIIAVVGSIISGSYAKESIVNYAGFGMLLAGIAASILGIFGTVATTLRVRLSRESPVSVTDNKPKMLYLSVWSIGAGAALAVIGSILGGAYEKATVINNAGFGMLLSGICVFVLGFFGTVLATLQTRINQDAFKVDRPKFLFYSILSMGVGTALTIIGSTMSRSFAKETMMNFTGFGTLLAGIVVLSIGISGTVAEILKNGWYQKKQPCEDQPRIMFGSVWAIGIGAMLVIIGSLLAGSYEKNSLLNFTGFGMLLVGTGVFVYGVFETTRISAMDLLSRKRNGTLTKTSKMDTEECESKNNQTLPLRVKKAWRNMVSTRAVLNVAGIMVAVGLLFFSLWQLDLIVSGPVWWQSSPTGQGWSWQGPGAYANDYFQCFFWKTTVGEAYDTLFLLVFISFIVMFASAFFWPRFRTKDADKAL